MIFLPFLVDFDQGGFSFIKKKKAWHIGPASLCNRCAEEKAKRGKVPNIDQYESMKWLDPKNLNSVVHVCFGTTKKNSDSQIREIVKGLEMSKQEFIWVVKKEKNEQENEEIWLPCGCEKRVIQGWALPVLFSII